MDSQEFRSKEFPQLDNNLYFDFAGSMLASQSQAKKYQKFVNEVLTNPHSSSQINRANNEIAQLRSLLLSRMNTTPNDYFVVFTHNTTAAAQTLANLLKINDTGFTFNYIYDNHNSILGLSSIFKSRCKTAQINCIQNIIDISCNSSKQNSLFAFPMVSNFNGTRYPLDWIQKVQDSNSLVLLDAASTTMCDLSQCSKPDFVILSLLKLFGSHGGALLIRCDRASLLNDPPPAGGNLAYSCSRIFQPNNEENFKLLPIFSKRFEGGTVAYTDLLLALEGLKVRKSFGTEVFINQHLTNLSNHFYTKMNSLVHNNGKKLVKFYQSTFDYPTFAFNLLKDGSGATNPTDDELIINHHDILFAFSALNVNIRSGSQCNPGATFTNLNWTPEEVVALGKRSNQNNKCVSSLCIVDGKPVSTLRVSFGYPTTINDINKFIDILSRLFLNGGPNPDLRNKEIILPLKIERIFISPIQGCLGYEVKESLYNKDGFIFDRKWKFVDSDGNLVSTPQCFGVASIVASIVNNDQSLRITYNKKEFIDVPVNITDAYINHDAPEAVKQQGMVYSTEVSDFLLNTIGVYAYLVKTAQSGKFPFSMVTQESCDALCPNFDIERWHANLVLSGAPAFSEEGMRKEKMMIGDRPITIWRWRTVCMTSSVIPGIEEVGREEMKRLVESRSNYGMSPFGALFGVDVSDCQNGLHKMAVGDMITEDTA